MKFLNKYIDRVLYLLRRLRRYIMWLDTNKRCSYCGTPISFAETTLDHIISVSNGGSGRSENLTPACQPCNRLKGSRDIRVFRNQTIGKNRGFYYQTGEPIDVVRAKLWIKLYGLLMKQVYVDQISKRPYYISTARDRLINAGLIKPYEDA